MKKKRLTQRLLSIILGILVLLLACACASVDTPSNSSSAEETSKESSALEVSEMNAEITESETESSAEESSETESSDPDEELSENSEATLSEDVTITPIEPTYPEERETTLELVKEYPLGGEGGIPFALFVGENPAYVMPHVSDWFLADEKGNIYAYNGQRFYDFQTSRTFRPSEEDRLIAAEIIFNGMWYCMTLDGVVNIYTEQGGKVDSVKYPKLSGDGIYNMFVSPDGKLRVVADGVFYDETGKKTAEQYVLDTVKNGDDTLDLLGRTYSYSEDLYVQSYADGILTACESQDFRSTQCPDGIDHSHVENYNEVIFYQYDKSGDPLSEFLICIYYASHKIPCNIVYEGVECKEYSPRSVIVGKQRFDNLIDANWFVGADGTIYLMLIDPEGGKLYKINPGYSDVTFTDFETDMETAMQQTAAASATVKHANVSADAAEMRADEMSKLSWTVQPENRYVRTGAALPHHLAKEDYDLTQTGIPYCWGGYNGIDTVTYGVYRGICFTDIITQDAADGQFYMSGNINSTIVANTVGLDCSGYACSVYDFASRTNTAGFVNYNYGHAVAGALQKMDLLVMENYHCYLFVGEYGTSQYLVYDCTRMEEIDKASLRLVDKSDCTGFKFRRLCYTYTSTATHHTYSCTTCNISETESHTFGDYVDTTSLWHTKTCSVCGYEEDQVHTYTYEPNNEITHKRMCTVCGFYTLHGHTLTYEYMIKGHWQICSVCNYKTGIVAHTLDYDHSTTQHWLACETCEYEGSKSDHTYSVYGKCTVCGYIESTGTLDYDDLIPPEDGFVVLCIDPKEEIVESVQK